MQSEQINENNQHQCSVNPQIHKIEETNDTQQTHTNKRNNIPQRQAVKKMATSTRKDVEEIDEVSKDVQCINKQPSIKLNK